MGHIIADLKETFRRGNIFIQLIYINVGIFVIGTLIHVFLRLFEVNTLDIFNIFALPLLSGLSINRGRCLPICLCMPVFCTFYSICFGYTGSGVYFFIFSRQSI